MKLIISLHKFKLVDSGAGGVFTYSQVGGVWSLLQAITPGYPNSYFGFSLAYSGDGMLAVGAVGYSK